MRLLLLLAICLHSLFAQDARLLPLTILHWNDFHSHNEPYRVTVKSATTQRDTSYFVGGAANFLGYLNHYRAQAQHVLSLHAGDEFQGTPVSLYTFGRSQIELLNIIRPDAMVLGNHEFDYGSERLRSYFPLARFPLLSANVFDAKSNKTFGEPTLLFRKGEMSIGVIGVTHPDLETLVIRDSLVGIVMLDPDSVVAHHAADLRMKGADIIIALTHQGWAWDSVMAMKHPSIDVIVSGHDHTPFFKPRKVNRSVIVQAGHGGRYLGKLDLMVDTQGDSIYSYQGRLIENRLGVVPPDSVLAVKVEELEGALRAAMNEVIGTLKTPWQRTTGRERRESNIGNWQTDVMRAYAQADVAFQNSSGIRTSLDAGPITVGDMWRINPFGNFFVVVTVPGSVLRRMLEFQAGVNTQEWCQVSGIRYVFDSRKPMGERIMEVEVGGKPIDDMKSYRVVTNNYVLSNSTAHFGVDLRSYPRESLPKLDRDVFIDAIRQQKIIVSVIDGRVKDLALQ
jgi:2',3'-cyclic-nucleotide 2'-phosphodiesterase (5'-nucleotidase family)